MKTGKPEQPRRNPARSMKPGSGEARVLGAGSLVRHIQCGSGCLAGVPAASITIGGEQQRLFRDAEYRPLDRPASDCDNRGKPERSREKAMTEHARHFVGLATGAAILLSASAANAQKKYDP